ncbi:MAG: PQQ-dependent sugar dehydrogenase [Pirellulaceae bacterium]|nr:PQQ-dependent sugar dehydrogenase [Pirellulaceae bacterium]
MRGSLLLAFGVAWLVGDSSSLEAQTDLSAARAKSGIEKRVPWTGSRIRGTPDPPLPYTTAVAFPGLKFYEPLELVSVPGSTRMAVVERPGKIYTFETAGDQADQRLLLDTGRTTYGAAFHPRFQRNGYVFVAADRPGAAGEIATMQVLRYRVRNDDPLSVDPATETVLLGWPSDGHRGGCLRFGPDGYLYISVGDGSGIADQLQTGQDLSDLLGSLLRIDVDHPRGELAYSIPDDNPFVNRPGARGEIFSYGHRQVWKFSFDDSGRLWGGEVGQDLWEMLYLIQKGGNYGWSVREGKHPFRPDRPQGPTPFQDPLVEHNHDAFRSITGGYIYKVGRSHPLNGHYIYGDYDTGRVWGLRYEEGQVKDQRELADTQLRIVAFGQLPSGEVLLLDFPGGQMHRLVPAPPREAAAEFPRKLSETGLFASTRDLRPAPGLIPYSVNAPLWSDGAEKMRYIALPGMSRIEFETVTYPQPAPGAQPGWRFPDGTVLVKTFSLDLQQGDPSSRRRLETRILHHERMPGNDDEYGNQVWRGYTYVWNEDQTDAELLGPDALDRTFTVRDPAAPGGRRELTWHFPSRAECTLCHTMSAKYVLGVNTLQMNKDHDYGGVVANQLSTLDHLGVFRDKLPRPPHELPRIVAYRSADEPLNLRARAYLHANCAHCHRKWGGGNAEFQLLASLPLDETGTLGVGPQQGRFDLPDPRLLVAGRPDQSMVLFRMRRLGLGRMPHVASNLVDAEAVHLISQWIEQLQGGDDLRQTGLAPGGR